MVGWGVFMRSIPSPLKYAGLVLLMAGFAFFTASGIDVGKSFAEDLFSRDPLSPIVSFETARFQKNEEISSVHTRIPLTGRAIVADLSAMTITLYEDAIASTTLPIKAVGRKGTPWETPDGVYEVKAMEKKHFSSIGEVWMPYSMQFFGNYFIHGWPYYEDGKEVPEGYSGGCIRLATTDAAAVFAFADVGTPIIVYRSAHGEVSGAYLREDLFGSMPVISAESFVVADVESGERLYERAADRALPIASLSKLMTALISLEAINQYREVTISQHAYETPGAAGNLSSGEEFTTGDLLYPLLLESSNDAAVALAEQLGERRFASLMNEKARAIGLIATSFHESTGLSEKNVSTANELFALVQHIERYKRFVFDVTVREEKKLGRHTWRNVIEFAGSDEFRGGKNGYTDEAKQTYVGLFALPLGEDGTERTVAIILLGSDDRKRDTEKILSYLKKDVRYASR